MWQGYEKKYKLGVGHFHEKSLHKNELSPMNIFRVRRIGREGLGFEKNQNYSKKSEKSPKLHFGVNKKDLNLLFHFHI